MGIVIEKSGVVWTVIIDRAAARNAIDPEHAQALFEAFNAFDADATASVAVFTGAGGAFCAGFDLKHAASLPKEARPLARGISADPVEPMPPGPMGPSRLLLSKPVIAAIEGPAVAGGMELALWADMRVMAESAYMGVYCRRWGVPLIDGGTVRLPRLIGMGHAMDLILTGRRVDAPEALAMGLCNRVVAPGTAVDAARVLALQLAAFPQATMLADRASAYAQWDLPLAEALHQEWQWGRERLSDGLQGAERFAAGEGRHGRP